MSKIPLHEALRQSRSQGLAAQSQNTFEAYFRQAAMDLLVAAMEEEVRSHCGPAYARQDGEFERGGSAKGRVQFNGETLPVNRLRMRKKVAGEGREVPLMVYQEASDPQQLTKLVLAAIQAGVSTRDMKMLYPEAQGVSASRVSRHWQAAGAAQVAALRERSLAGLDFVGLFFDGVRLSEDQMAVAALGLQADGTKMVLDFELGASENEGVCTELIQRLLRRGLDGGRRRLILTDGGKGLLSAIRQQFPEGLLQRCLVHKERNLRNYLSHKHYGWLGQLFKRWRLAQGLEQALEILAELRAFLKRVNAKALVSLDEAGEELLGVFLLDLPNTLHESLLSTNCIENLMLNLRRRTDRVKRWRANTTMAEHWLAFGLMRAEEGFRRIKNYQDLPALLAALTLPPEILESRRALIRHSFSLTPRA